MIRPYHPSDRPALLEIFRLNAPRWFHPGEEKDLEAYLDAHGDTYFVAEVDGQIAGSGGYHLSEDGKCGRISWFMFRPEQQGKGLGKKQVAHALEQLKRFPLEKIEVWTSQMQDAFYAKFGFVALETKADFWGPGMDLVRMELN